MNKTCHFFRRHNFVVVSGLINAQVLEIKSARTVGSKEIGDSLEFEIELAFGARGVDIRSTNQNLAFL